MGAFLDPVQHPDGCNCSWIMGYGVDEDCPYVWAEKILIREEDCEFHGKESEQADGGGDGVSDS